MCDVRTKTRARTRTRTIPVPITLKHTTATVHLVLVLVLVLYRGQKIRTVSTSKLPFLFWKGEYAIRGIQNNAYHVLCDGNLIFIDVELWLAGVRNLRDCFIGQKINQKPRAKVS